MSDAQYKHGRRTAAIALQLFLLEQKNYFFPLPGLSILFLVFFLMFFMYQVFKIFLYWEEKQNVATFYMTSPHGLKRIQNYCEAMQRL